MHKTGMINGVTFDGPARPPITEKMFKSLDSTGVNWISICPEVITFRNTLNTQSYDKTGQWYGETIHACKRVTHIAKSKGYRVMLKPHVGFDYDISEWDSPLRIDLETKDSLIRNIVKNSAKLSKIKDPSEFILQSRNHPDLKQHYKQIDAYYDGRKAYISTLPNKTKGTWRGDFEVNDATDWPLWEKGYTRVVLQLAQLADSLQVDLFCIGTELSLAAVQRPQFWRTLIDTVRKVYNGPITFSANWDSYLSIGFWDACDFLGISAYFPLSEKTIPSVHELKRSWKKHRIDLEALSNTIGKPIIFTEYGYKSVEYAAKEPWKEYVQYAPNEQAQSNLYQALYSSFWDLEWFKGGFVWKWFYQGNGGDRSYSPQGKRAESQMINRYRKR